MEVKDILLNSENSLPTLEQNLSTSTSATPALPVITAQPATYFRFGGSLLVGSVGFVLLAYGKKMNDVQKMIYGAVLTIASFFF